MDTIVAQSIKILIFLITAFFISFIIASVSLSAPADGYHTEVSSRH